MFNKSIFFRFSFSNRKIHNHKVLADELAENYIRSLNKREEFTRILRKTDKSTSNLSNEIKRQMESSDPKTFMQSVQLVNKTELPNMDDINNILYEDAKPPSPLFTAAYSENIGQVNIYSSDIFKYKADAWVVPMVPNFMPIKGIGLEVLERGGQDMIGEAYSFIVKKKKKNNNTGLNRMNSSYRNEQLSLNVGDVIPVSANEEVLNCKYIFFVIMPYFWQGNSQMANRLLRYALNSVFNELSKSYYDGVIQSVKMTNIGIGQYGYSASRSAYICAESAHNWLNQTDYSGLKNNNSIYSSTSRYGGKSVHFFSDDIGNSDSSNSSCKTLVNQMKYVYNLYCPAMRKTSASSYYENEESIRLLLPSTKYETSKFYNSSSIYYRARNKKKFDTEKTKRRIYRQLWRTQVVGNPNELMVNSISGEVMDSDHQIKPVHHIRNKTGYDHNSDQTIDSWNMYEVDSSGQALSLSFMRWKYRPQLD